MRKGLEHMDNRELLIELVRTQRRDTFLEHVTAIINLVFLAVMILVLVILAAMLPLVNVMSTGLTEAITNQLAHSHVASYLYNENILLLLLQSHFG